MNPDSPKPPTAKTVREIYLENLLRQAIPYIINLELSTKTSQTLRDLIQDIRNELG